MIRDGSRKMLVVRTIPVNGSRVEKALVHINRQVVAVCQGCGSEVSYGRIGGKAGP